MGRRRTLDRTKLMLAVCERIATGQLVEDAAKAEGTISRRIRQWAQDPEYAPMYARAREDQAHAFAEQALAIADDPTGDWQRDRLRVDTRKWMAARVAPKHYGDKVDVTSGDKPLATPQVVMIGDKRIEF